MVTVNALPLADRPLAEQLALLSRLPVDAVGLPLSSLEQAGWSEAARLVRLSPVTVHYVFTGIHIAVDDDAAWPDQRDLLQQGIQWAAAEGVPLLYFTSGRSGGLLMEDARAAFVAQITPVVEMAAARGVRLALENTLAGRGEFSFTNTLRDTLLLANQAGIDGLVVDLYCAWQEHDLASLVQAHAERVALLQVADFSVGTREQPDRRVPGQGNIPLERFLAALVTPQTVVDLELLGPHIASDPEAALSRGLQWLREHLADPQRVQWELS